MSESTTTPTNGEGRARGTVCETERLRLRHASRDDAEFTLELLNDPSFIRNIGDKGARTIDGAIEYLETRMIASYDRNGFGLYIVELKDDATPLGICGLVKRDGLEDPDVGFAFLPRHWGKGYAVESAAAVMWYARETLGIDRVVGITSPENGPSMRVLEKIGLTRAGEIDLPGIDGVNVLFVPAG